MTKLIPILLAALFQFWPGATYDAHIPTFRQVLGFDPGDHIASHQQILHYLDALAAASPRIKIFEYGQTWEDRKLALAALGSEANISLTSFRSVGIVFKRACRSAIFIAKTINLAVL